MRDGAYENRWSPFDPEWYQQAFDKFISTADQLFNQEDILAQGYVLPDADGSKSSVFRRNAVLNNSFNEQALRETLKDIYLNSSHKLIASNHDNAHFFKWNGHMSDVKVIPNTDLCEIVLPTEPFVVDQRRDRYKLSQFYHKWISITDILNNGNVFNWSCLLFINSKIYSDYELRIDDHETTIRFKYQPFWSKRNYTIAVYKFDTIAQARIQVTRRQITKGWDWKVPISEVVNVGGVFNSDHVMVAFNKISDPSIRTDGLLNVDVLGDNIEFFPIVDECIDMSSISDYNKKLIESEHLQPLWMSVMIPKFLHEYPILLPTDVIYRPYQPNLVPVFTEHECENIQVKADVDREDAKHNLYINVDDQLVESWDEDWKYVIRPIVLADAFDSQSLDIYNANGFYAALRSLRDLTVIGADKIEKLRNLVESRSDDRDGFDRRLGEMIDAINNIHTRYNEILISKRVPLNETYESIYNKFLESLEELRVDKYNYSMFDIPSSNPTNY